MKTSSGYASYTIPAKNMLALCILEVLRNYSDEQHRLSQKDIIYFLGHDFSLKINRTTVKSNLMSLIDFGYDIKYTEIKKEDTNICTDWYLEKAFSDEELDILFNCLIESNKLSREECAKLMKKLRRVLYKSTI